MEPPPLSFLYCWLLFLAICSCLCEIDFSFANLYTHILPQTPKDCKPFSYYFLQFFKFYFRKLKENLENCMHFLTHFLSKVLNCKTIQKTIPVTKKGYMKVPQLYELYDNIHKTFTIYWSVCLSFWYPI